MLVPHASVAAVNFLPNLASMPKCQCHYFLVASEAVCTTYTHVIISAIVSAIRKAGSYYCKVWARSAVVVCEAWEELKAFYAGRLLESLDATLSL